MDGNFKPYSYTASAERIDAILEQPSGQFVETESLPNRDKLTYSNGFYGYCSAVFVDIRDSSGLTEKHRRPTLAKIYRSFVSEMVAVLNSDVYVREVNIVGDCVWAVYNTPTTPCIDDVFTIACRANTLRKLLNAKLEKHGYSPLKLGIGVDYGRALMIQAGYSGSGINDVVYMGDVVNRAAHLANKAGRAYADPIWLGPIFVQNLIEDNSRWLTQIYDSETGKVHKGDVVLTDMNNWIDSTSH